MMNRKGQIGGVGAILMLVIGVIVCLVLLQASAPGIATVTSTVSVTNQTVTAPATNGNATILSGQAATVITVTNATSGTLIPASNYTIRNYVLSNGVLVNTFTSNGGDGGWQGKGINVTYTYEPYGYATDSGSRAVAGFILLFAALAIAIFALVPTLRSGVLEAIGR